MHWTSACLRAIVEDVHLAYPNLQMVLHPLRQLRPLVWWGGQGARGGMLASGAEQRAGAANGQVGGVQLN